MAGTSPASPAMTDLRWVKPRVRQPPHRPGRGLADHRVRIAQQRLRRAGYAVEEARVRANGKGRGARHVIWLANPT